jgi:phosphate acetyltransferase
MKGSLHTDELLGAVLDPATGLRTDRRVSHVYLMDLPAYPRPLLVTDAAVNIEPDLAAKRDICQNAIDLARWLGIERPRVAVLAAVETVNPRMRSTLDAAALSVMALRGQITGGVVEGPFAFDNAIDPAAARSKGLAGEVAGQADILLVPDIEAGNMVAKQLLYFAAADGAGIVLGARVPVILTSRSDGVRVRIASMALASLVAGRMRERAAEALVAAL